MSNIKMEIGQIDRFRIIPSGTVTGRITGSNSNAYFMQSRQLDKSQLMSAMYGAKPRDLGSGTWKHQSKFLRMQNKQVVIHVFHRTKGYMEITGTQQVPDHCYFLKPNYAKGQWFQKAKGNHSIKAISVSKVPPEHRLFLKINHIDQP